MNDRYLEFSANSGHYVHKLTNPCNANQKENDVENILCWQFLFLGWLKVKWKKLFTDFDGTIGGCRMLFNSNFNTRNVSAQKKKRNSNLIDGLTVLCFYLEISICSKALLNTLALIEFNTPYL